MTCPTCGRYAPPDAQTGYDCDDYCQSCAELADMVIEEDEPDPAALAEQSITSSLETIRQALEGAETVDRKIELHGLLTRLFLEVTTIQNRIFSEAQ